MSYSLGKFPLPYLDLKILILAFYIGVQPHFSTSDVSVKKLSSSIVFCHERSSSRALARILPTNLSVVANFDNTPNGVFSRIEPLLPQGITQEFMGTLCRSSPLLSKGFEVDAVTQVFTVARVVATEVMLVLATHFVESYEKTNIIGIGQLSGRDVRADELGIFDWTQAYELSGRVSSASSQVRLPANKTYLLVGMSGDLGQSVSHWMITRGARNIVLTSRTPKINSQRIDEMARFGARVRVECM